MNPEAKWRGKVSTNVTQATPNQIWSLYKDFFNFHKWFPTLSSCRGVSGSNGHPGCVRHCIGSSIPNNNNNGEVSWSKERLVSVNEDEKSLKYEIVESNIGFKEYVATVKIVESGEECFVEWMFEVAPVEGLCLEVLLRKYEMGLRATVEKMEMDYADTL